MENKGTLPIHLKLIPTAIEIPEGYKWGFVHEGWTLIPKINNDKFFAHEARLEIPSDEELVDQENDEDQDFLAEELADEGLF